MEKKGAAAIAVVGGVAIFLIKMAAYFMSGSVALLSDALESIVNIAASLLMLYAVYVSGMPADDDHHYGHQKIEGISSLIEGAFILTAAVFIIHTAIERIFDPVPLGSVEAALGVSLFATALNGGLSWFLGRNAEENGSMALEGDSKHLLSDVVTSAGVAVGLLVAEYTGLAVLDPVMALLVAVLIVRMGVKLVLKSSRLLMDLHDPEEERRIMEVLESHVSDSVDFHDLKTRRSGNEVYAEVHLSVDPSLTVEEAHNLADHLEDDLRSELPNTVITIHVEPLENAR
jgi:cation diffusion facilitator family transporter